MISSAVWKLSLAKGRCLARPLRALALTNPVLAVLAVLAVAAIVGGVTWVGVRNAPAMAAAASTDGGFTAFMMTSVVVTTMVVFAAVSLTVQHMSTAGESLDAQVRSTPLTRLELFLGTVGLPLSAFCLVLTAFSLLTFAPLVQASGASPFALLCLVLAGAGVFYAAGTAGEVLARLTSGQPAALLALLPPIAAWMGASALSGGISPFGITRPMSRSILGLQIETLSGLMIGSLLFFIVSFATWIALATFRVPEQRTFSYPGRSLSSPSSGSGATALVALKLLVRERKLQRHVALVFVASGVLSVSTAALFPNLPALAISGGSLTAALGIAIVPLTTPGMNGDAAWFWRSAPISAVSYASGVFLAGLCGGMLAILLPGAAVLTPLLWLEGAGGLGTLYVMVPVILLLAVGSGFLVPCKLRNTYEQILSYATLGALLVGVYVAASWSMPKLVLLGVPQSLFGAGLVLTTAVLGLAIAVLTESYRRRA